MAAARQNVDFSVLLEPGGAAAAEEEGALPGPAPGGPQQLRPGDVLHVRHVPEGGAGPSGGPCSSARACYDAHGGLVGAVPETARKRLACFGEVQGSVRSVRRDEAGRPRELVVRVAIVGGQPVVLQASRAPEEATQQQPEQGKPEPQPYTISDDGFQLQRAQLARLVDDEGLRVTLKDERLQRLLTEVDSSGNREKALEAALQGPAFQEVADKLLGLMDLTSEHAAPMAAAAAAVTML